MATTRDLCEQVSMLRTEQVDILRAADEVGVPVSDRAQEGGRRGNRGVADNADNIDHGDNSDNSDAGDDGSGREEDTASSWNIALPPSGT